MAKTRQIELVFGVEDGRVVAETTLDVFTSRRVERVADALDIDIENVAAGMLDAGLAGRTPSP